MRTFPPLLLILMLAACGGANVAPPAAALSRPEVHIAHHGLPHPAVPGGVIGADAETLIREFGAPRLDIRDGDARKLQWSGTACILDAYLYAADHGAQPTATFVDARRGDGRDVDRAACIAALRKN